MFVDEVREKIASLKALDKKLRLFGAEHHRYEFSPPFSEGDVLSLEQRHRISLPKDYRDFVLKVGNGGAGPYYGIYPIARDYNVHHGMSGDNGIILSVPFPHTKDWDEDWPREINWDAGERPSDDQDGDYFDNRHISGALCICQYGCGDFFLLVVNGNEKGNIWVDGRRNYSGIYRGGLEDGEREQAVTFSRWYLNWLDRSLAKLQNNVQA
jgi:SMI1 / KNR4 family (SUKH-1)